MRSIAPMRALPSCTPRCRKTARRRGKPRARRCSRNTSARTVAGWPTMPSRMPAKPPSRAASSCWPTAARWPSTAPRPATTSPSSASPAARRPKTMLQRAGARGGEAVLLYYGPNSTALLDATGLEMIEAVRAHRRAHGGRDQHRRAARVRAVAGLRGRGRRRGVAGRHPPPRGRQLRLAGDHAAAGRCQAGHRDLPRRRARLPGPHAQALRRGRGRACCAARTTRAARPT